MAAKPMSIELESPAGNSSEIVTLPVPSRKQPEDVTPLYVAAEIEVDQIDVVGQQFTASGWIAFFWEFREEYDEKSAAHAFPPTPASLVSDDLLTSNEMMAARTPRSKTMYSRAQHIHRKYPVNPKVLFDNGIHNEVTHDPKYTYNPDTNVVTWKFQFEVVLTERMELQRFPFDRQHLHAILNVRTDCWRLLPQAPDAWRVPAVWKRYLYDYPLVFRLAESVSGWRPRSPLVDYRTTPDGIGERGTARKSGYERTGKPTFIMRVERESSYYVYNIVLPLFLIVGLSAISFAIDTGLGERAQVTVTLLLTAVTFKFVVSDSLPSMGYLTLLDKYVILSYVMLTLVTVENTVETWLSKTNAERLDRLCAMSFGGFWVALHVFIYYGAKYDYFRIPWNRLHLVQSDRDVHTRIKVQKDPGHIFMGEHQR